MARWLFFIGMTMFSSCAQESPKINRSQPGTVNNEGTVSPGAVNQSATPEQKAGETSSSMPVDTSIPAGPTTAAIVVANGGVSFDLASAKPALTGASLTAILTVNAAAGSAPASLSLSALALKTPTNTGMVAYRPVLVWVAADGKETQFPIGTNINEKIPKARTVPLAGLTTVAFEGIDTGAKIKLRFSALEPLADALLDGIPNYRECKAPQNFTAVANALQPCKSCHNGLFAYDFMEKDNATACGQNLKIIDKTLSGSGLTPNIPTGTHHGVNASAVGTAIGPWRTGEGL